MIRRALAFIGGCGLLAAAALILGAAVIVLAAALDPGLTP